MRTTTISHSQRTIWNLCRQLWWLRYVVGLRPATPPLRLLIGSIWHRMMDAWWTARATGEPTGTNAWSTLCTLSETLPEDARSAVYDTLDSMLDTYHREYYHDTIRLVHSERRLDGPLRSPFGRRSSVLRHQGVVDKIVEIDGEHWIVEHKHTSQSLDLWVEQSTHGPQPYEYALLVRDALGLDVVGVIYDVTRYAVAPTPEDWQVIKSGKALVKRYSALATADTLLGALKLHGFGLDDVPWYREALETLQQRKNPLLRRVWIRLDQRELDRVHGELYAEARRIRDAQLAVREYAHHRRSTTETARALVEEHQAMWPRSPSACYQWGRQCEWFGACNRCSDKTIEAMSLRTERD